MHPTREGVVREANEQNSTANCTTDDKVRVHEAATSSSKARPANTANRKITAENQRKESSHTESSEDLKVSVSRFKVCF